MKLLVFPSWFPNEENPQHGIFFSEHVDALAREHEVTVITCEVLPIRQAHRQGITVTSDRGYTRIHVRGVQWIPRKESAWRDTLEGLARKGFAHAPRPDVIIAQHVDPMGWVAEPIAQTAGIPFLLNEQATFLHKFKDLPQHEAIQQAFARAQVVTVPSLALAARLREHGYRDEMEIVPNLVRTDFFHPAECPPENELPTLLSVGNLYEQKGYNHLLPAFAELHQQLDGLVRLRIGGKGHLRQALEEQAQSLGISAAVTFLGQLSRDEVRAEMQACDVFVMASVIETFCIVAGEALACGKPVIATRCGGPEEFIDPSCGAVVDPGDEAGLAAAMQDMLARRGAMDVSTIRARAETFGPDAYGQRMEAILTAMIQPTTI